MQTESYLAKARARCRGRKVIADDLGLSEQQFNNILHGRIKQSDLLHLPVQLAKATNDPGYINDLLEIHAAPFVAVPSSIKDRPVDVLSWVSKATDSLLSVAQEFTADIADGKIDAVEAGRLLERLREMDVLTGSIRALALKALKNTQQLELQVA